MGNTDSNSTCSTSTANSTCTGLLLPLAPRTESEWPIAVAAILYCIGLLYSFLAVSAIADIFMCAIEVITSQTKTVNIKHNGQDVEVEVRVWNYTIANLSLMALGSSAPEILLSVIEVVGNDFEAGELGPSTIVGSAAFNLLVITAVCIVSVPAGETSRINAINVFAVTAFFSVFAYLWLYFTLKVTSPDEVELWEALVSLCLFGVLLLVAYAADKHFCMKKVDPESNGSIVSQEPLSESGVSAETVVQSVAPNMSVEEASIVALRQMAQSRRRSRLWYRVNAVRGALSGRRLLSQMPLSTAPEKNLESETELSVLSSNGDFIQQEALEATVQFAASAYSVYEHEKKVTVGLTRYGNMDIPATVRFETVDGTATSGDDYVAKNGQVTFSISQSYQSIDIPIVDDNVAEDDEVFFIKLSDPGHATTVGSISVAEVKIIDDDTPGILQFAESSYSFVESAGEVQLTVIRTQGSDGDVTVNWKTKDGSAVSGKDYVSGAGTIAFKHSEGTKTICITLIDDKTFEKDEIFYVELESPTGGAKLGKIKKAVVTIVDDDEYKTWVDSVVRLTGLNMHRLEMGASSWRQQFHEAMTVNGGDVDSATCMDYVMHVLTFGFKVLFAFVPPVSFGRGWPAFVVSLFFIGILTAVIGDLANIFGCFIGLEPSVTAITFVAVGTSLPDLFASRTAALAEPHADAAIGNVTGSNSVNVFLGLGISWVIAASYWLAKGESFVVPAGTLSFSLVGYCIVAFLCIGLLLVRRFFAFFGRAELGGPVIVKYISAIFLLVLWVLYILMSSLKAYCII